MNNAKNIASASCLLALGLSLSSCDVLAPKPSRLMPLAPVANATDMNVYKDLQNKPLSNAVRPKADIVMGTESYGSGQHWQPQGSEKAGTYDLKFEDADLGDVTKAVLGDMLKLNYVINPKVTGRVTIQTTQPLTKDELLPTLEMLLRMNNAALVKDGKIYHIEPVADALFATDLVTGKGQNGFQTRVIPVRNVAASEIYEVIKPLVQEKTILHVDGTRNIMVASGTPEDMSRVMDLVNIFDIDILKNRSFGLFPLIHSDPEEVAKELEEIFVGKVKGKSDEAEFFRFMPIERLNSVMAITHQGRYLQDIENWVLRLDKANTANGGGVNVYKVQHADAEDLADTLNEIFSGAQKQDKSAKVSPGQKSTQLSGSGGSSGGLGSNSSSSSNGSNSSGFGSGSGSSGFGGAAGSPSSSKKSKQGGKSGGGGGGGTVKVANVDNVRIISDKTNNALITVATAREYEVILPVIKQLDILPLQVLIDATIVSVKLTDDLQYGIQWFLNHQGSSFGAGGGITANSTTGQLVAGLNSAASSVATGGLNAVYNSGVVDALLSALASKNDINVISSPSLMVLNNQEATITVGDQIPILSSSLSGVSTASSSGLVTSNSIQYKDTGVNLVVTPRVNANGMVIMDIKQVVSEPVQPTPGVGPQSATISKKEIESSVAVLDGETIVLGGLISENITYNQAGVPFLYNLPWIGPLFGATTNNKDKTELVVLITPRVVKSKQDSRMISQEFKRKLTGIYR